ncbi:MAG TPA: GNAT family N-acetyltransferase [Bacteroidia bacterium]|nr:GNAT family N-acetyltransferase [Bacteroidia bacterium]
MKTLVRKGTKPDIPVVLELIRELARYEKADGEVEVSVDQMVEWGFGSNPLFRFFVAEIEGQVRGTALFYHKYSTWKGKCIFLEDIIVQEAFRAKGIGSKLFDAVLQVARQEGVKRLEWQVLEWNKPAIRFYEKYHATMDAEWLNCKLTEKQIQSL